ncbi:hypothetical protein AC623_09885 [Bacillus sp. FJAT-27231]|uniref:hypothetical protein n=1 Tax=Bacillus sp. FJAT-27231 TaxID=1679168 RepID=UPI000670B225|nr:hypothetical protein [Bacillus sp. FJAT-27231]KMY54205.1 hypothetical protein AC623_09885 [Bacillus sp. FJAT-27231]
MKLNVKKSFFWGAIGIVILLFFKFALSLMSFFSPSGQPLEQGFVGRGHGRGPGFEPHHVMHGACHGGYFPWIGLLLFLVIALAAVVLFFKWLRRKNDSLEQFVNIPLTDSSAIFIESNADILDTWEKNQTMKKENDNDVPF